jgi:hypothetical protein
MTKDQDRLWEVMLQYHSESVAAHTQITTDLSAVRQEIAALHVKAGVWGLIAGLIPGTLALLVLALTRLL